jgi:hypothetical protein
MINETLFSVLASISGSKERLSKVNVSARVVYRVWRRNGYRDE